MGQGREGASHIALSLISDQILIFALSRFVAGAFPLPYPPPYDGGGIRAPSEPHSTSSANRLITRVGLAVAVAGTPASNGSYQMPHMPSFCGATTSHS